VDREGEVGMSVVGGEIGVSANSSRDRGSISRAARGGETNGLAFVKLNNPNRHITLSSISCYFPGRILQRFQSNDGSPTTFFTPLLFRSHFK